MATKVNKGGRPLLGKEPRKRYQVVLEPPVAEKLRDYGRGNLSAGITQASHLIKPKRPPS